VVAEMSLQAYPTYMVRDRLTHVKKTLPQLSKPLRASQYPTQVVAERGLQAYPAWMNKCIQLYETYLVRHGIMLVGPSGSGKTTIMECLAAALTELGTKTVLWRMNPKVTELNPEM
jgi:polynucleotide 5'-kinase involved in rRNA processing